MLVTVIVCQCLFDNHTPGVTVSALADPGSNFSRTNYIPLSRGIWSKQWRLSPIWTLSVCVTGVSQTHETPVQVSYLMTHRKQPPCGNYQLCILAPIMTITVDH